MSEHTATPPTARVQEPERLHLRVGVCVALLVCGTVAGLCLVWMFPGHTRLHFWLSQFFPLFYLLITVCGLYSRPRRDAGV